MSASFILIVKCLFDEVVLINMKLIESPISLFRYFPLRQGCLSYLQTLKMKYYIFSLKLNGMPLFPWIFRICQPCYYYRNRRIPRPPPF